MSYALKAVSAGFRLVYIGLTLVVLAHFTYVVANQAGVAGRELALWLNGLSMVGVVVGLAGRYRCLAVPAEAGSARPLLTVSLALSVIGLASTLVLLANLVHLFLSPEMLLAVAASGPVSSIAASVLFLLFTKETARYVRRPGLAARSMSVLWMWMLTLVLLVAGFAFLLGAPSGARPGSPPAARAGDGLAGAAAAASALMILGGVAGQITLIRCVILLVAMSRATLAFAQGRTSDGGFVDEDDRPLRRRDADDYDPDRPRRRRRRRGDEDDPPPRRRGADDGHDRPRRRDADDYPPWMQ
jgi:hypothetical protein